MVAAGCYILSSLTCSTMSGSQGHPAALPTGSGSQHVIFDRILISGCDDITMLTCFDSAEALVQLQGGQHLSIIDSYVIDADASYLWVTGNQLVYGLWVHFVAGC